MGSHNGDMEAPPEANTAAAEISSIYRAVEAAAREHRQATVSIVAQPPTSAATMQTTDSSVVWKIVAGGPASGRVCFFYAINMAWDRKRPLRGGWATEAAGTAHCGKRTSNTVLLRRAH